MSILTNFNEKLKQRKFFYGPGGHFHKIRMLISPPGKSKKFFEVSCHNFQFWHPLCKGFTQDLAKMAILEGDAISKIFLDRTKGEVIIISS